jgi:hypothetical protein
VLFWSANSRPADFDGSACRALRQELMSLAAPSASLGERDLFIAFWLMLFRDGSDDLMYSFLMRCFRFRRGSLQ